MLSCIVGKYYINSVDYPEIELRSWSDRKLLKCPVCGGNLIYKCGKIKIPHFAHEKDCECNYTFYENETKEHALGKVLLYKWLKVQPNVENVQLESYIPETKQRPDLYFESEGVRYVIEYQCSPILKSEYEERHELYKLNEIIDIWVFGVEKYEYAKFEEIKPEVYYCFNHRVKESERFIENNGFKYYLNPFTEQMFVVDNDEFSFISKIVVKFYGYVSKINECWFDVGNLFNNSYANNIFNNYKKSVVREAEKINEEKIIKSLKDQQNIFDNFINEIISNDKTIRPISDNISEHYYSITDLKDALDLEGNLGFIKLLLFSFNVNVKGIDDLVVGEYNLNNEIFYVLYSKYSLNNTIGKKIRKALKNYLVKQIVRR